MTKAAYLRSLSHSMNGQVFAVLIGIAIPAAVFGRVILAAFAALAVVTLIASGLRQPAWQMLRRQITTAAGISILVLMAVWTVSSLLSIFPSRSLEGTTRTVLFAGIGVVVYGALRHDPDLRRLCLRALLAATLVCCTLAIVERTLLPELYWALRFKGWRSVPLVTEMKAFSALAVILVPLALLGAWRERGLFRIIALGSMLAALTLIWETGNRSVLAGFIGMTAALTVSLIASGLTRKAAYFTTLGTTAGLLVAVFWLYFTRQEVVGLAPGNDWLFPVWLIDFERQSIWVHVLDIARQNPWFGVGANTINFTPGADAPLPGHTTLHIIPAHPHNWVVEVLAETGGLGIAALLSVIAGVSFRLLRHYRARRSPATLAAIAIMAGYWVSGLFNFSYWSAWWQVSFVLGMAMSLAYGDDK